VFTEPYAEISPSRCVRLERPVENIHTEFEPSDFHIGDTITWWFKRDPDNEYHGTIKRIDYDGGIFGISAKVSNGDLYDMVPFANADMASSIVVTEINHKEHKKPMGNYGLYSERQIKDIQTGDNIVYSSNQDRAHIKKEATVESVEPDCSDSAWVLCLDDGDWVYPMNSNVDYYRNVTILSIVRNGKPIIPEYGSIEDVDSNDGDWVEVLSLNDRDVSIFDEELWTDNYENLSNETVKSVLMNGVLHVYRKKKVPKSCDLSSIKHGYFMLMNNESDENGNHNFHDNTIYYNHGQYVTKIVSIDIDEIIGDWDVSSCISRIHEEVCFPPDDTFAVKPNPTIFLRTMNGDMNNAYDS
jgi:hypothetical protein